MATTAASSSSLPAMSTHDAKVLNIVFDPEGATFDDEPIPADVPNAELTPELTEQLKALEGQGVALAERNDISGAIAKFTEAVQLCPTYPSAYNNRAQAYRIQENLEAALQDLDKAIETGRAQPSILKQAYTQRAIIKREKGDKEGAQVDFERGAKFGNPVAKAVSVQENPISKLCGAMVMEMLNKEIHGDKP